MQADVELAWAVSAAVRFETGKMLLTHNHMHLLANARALHDKDACASCWSVRRAGCLAFPAESGWLQVLLHGFCGKHDGGDYKARPSTPCASGQALLYMPLAITEENFSSFKAGNRMSAVALLPSEPPGPGSVGVQYVVSQ